MVQSKQVRHVDWDKELDSKEFRLGNPHDLSAEPESPEQKAEQMSLEEIQAKVAEYNHRSSFGTYLMYRFWSRVLDIKTKVGES